jgi:hypothetical protein
MVPGGCPPAGLFLFCVFLKSSIDNQDGHDQVCAAFSKLGAVVQPT